MAHHAQLGRAAACLLLAAAAQGPGGRSAQRGKVWIDPDRTEPSGTHDRLFATPSRGAGTEASYLIYLPPDYETATRRYPVLYWLHGGGSQRESAWMVARIDGQIRAGNLPPFIVVLVQGLPDVRDMNSKDGTRPLEDVVIKDLLPHVDATYRTVATRQGAIEGGAMGGFGSLRLGFRFPELFGTVSALAPSIMEIKDEPPIVLEPFGNGPAYYEEVGPCNIKRRVRV
jgi:enterochelin esterase-like enzyme